MSLICLYDVIIISKQAPLINLLFGFASLPIEKATVEREWAFSTFGRIEAKNFRERYIRCDCGDFAGSALTAAKEGYCLKFMEVTE